MPSDQARFLNQNNQPLKWLIKYLKRRLIFELLGCPKYLAPAITEAHQRILWISLSAPSLGDALMDASGRHLLDGRTVDLLTSSKNAALFSGDRYFRAVFTDPEETKRACAKEPYDLCILDAFNPRVLLTKHRICPKTDFVGMYGFLNGFEVHRTCFSFARLEQLLGLPNQSTKPWAVHHALGGSGWQRFRNPAAPLRVAIGVGGEWAYRTYTGWADVIVQLIRSMPGLEVYLLGSDNGLALAKQIEQDDRVSGVLVNNLVGQLSLDQTAAVLRHSDVYLGADGGLWHLAVGAGVPSVVVFAAKALFDESGGRVGLETRDQAPCLTIHVPTDVNEARPTEIVELALDLIKRTGPD